MSACLYESTREGPDMPIRYGSAKTVVCVCGAYKLVTWLGKDLSGWRDSNVDEDVKQAEEASEDL